MFYVSSRLVERGCAEAQELLDKLEMCNASVKAQVAAARDNPGGAALVQVHCEQLRVYIVSHTLSDHCEPHYWCTMFFYTFV